MNRTSCNPDRSLLPALNTDIAAIAIVIMVAMRHWGPAVHRSHLHPSGRNL